MTNHKIRSIAIVAMLLVTGVTMIGIAGAQEAGNTSTMSKPTTTDQAGNESVVTSISQTVTLVDYRWNDQTITMTINADYSQPIVLSDMFVSGSGATKIPQKRLQLDTGKNTIRFDTTVWKGTKGVVVGTTDGSIGISENAGGFSFNSKYPAESLIGITVVGIITGIGLVLALAYKRELDYTSDVTQEL